MPVSGVVRTVPHRRAAVLLGQHKRSSRFVARRKYIGTEKTARFLTRDFSTVAAQLSRQPEQARTLRTETSKDVAKRSQAGDDAEHFLESLAVGQWTARKQSSFAPEIVGVAQRGVLALHLVRPVEGRRAGHMNVRREVGLSFPGVSFGWRRPNTMTKVAEHRWSVCSQTLLVQARSCLSRRRKRTVDRSAQSCRATACFPWWTSRRHHLSRKGLLFRDQRPRRRL